MNPSPRNRWKRPIAFALLGGMLWLRMGAGQPVEPPRNPFAADEWRLPGETRATPLPVAGTGPKDPLQTHCQLCHSLDYVSTQPTLTRPQWSAIVEKMRGKFGAVIPTNQLPEVLETLSREGARTGDGSGRR